MKSYFSFLVIIFSSFLYACGTMTAPGAAMHSSTTSQTSLVEEKQKRNESHDSASRNASTSEVQANISDADAVKKIEVAAVTDSVVDKTRKDQHARILATINTTQKGHRKTNTTQKIITQNSSQSDLTTDAPKNMAASTVVIPVAGVSAVLLDQQPPAKKVVVANISDNPSQQIALEKKQEPKGSAQTTVNSSKNTQAIEFDTKSREESIKYSLANRYYQSGKYQSTIDILETPKSNDLKNTKNRDLLVLAYTAYAQELASKADLLEAQNILEKAILMQPANNVIRRQLSKIKNIREANQVYKNAIDAYNSGNQEKAFESFHRVLILNPSHKKAKKYYTEIKTIVVGAHHKKALKYYRRQQLSQAIEEWDILLKVDPGNDFARIYRSRAIELQKKFEKL